MDHAGTEFPPTPWSLILRIQQGWGAERREALASVCEQYWQPIYVYARMLGQPVDDAEDLTQEFFAKLDRAGLWDRAAREKGRLRSLLIGAFKRVAADHHRRRQAEKRGGRAPHFPLDSEQGEQSYAIENRPGVVPDAAYDHAWALTVFYGALREVEEDYRAAGKAHLFAALKPLLMKTGTESQRETAARLKTTESAVKSSLHQLRTRYREHFRQVVRATLTDEEDLEEEVRYLLNLIKERGGL